jgi:hypothetical protein
VASDRDLDPLRRRSDFRGVLADASVPRDPFWATLPPAQVAPDPLAIIHRRAPELEAKDKAAEWWSELTKPPDDSKPQP